MKKLKINKTSDVDNDLLMIEVGDDQYYPMFVLSYNEKTGELKINFPFNGRTVDFGLDEFQELVERLKVTLKDWAVNVADKN